MTDYLLMHLPIPLPAALISAAISAAISIAVATYNHLYTTKPLLVFIRRPTATWKIRNIGHGAAFNVLLRDIGRDGVRKHYRIYPIGDGDEVELEKLKYGNVLELYFTNATGRRKYRTICQSWEQDVRRRWRGGIIPEDFSDATDESKLHPDIETRSATTQDPQ